MRKLLSMGLLMIGMYGCDGDPEPDPPNCNDGIQNGNETGIDCGGDCYYECFSCLSESCTLLSGATSETDPKTIKIWITADSISERKLEFSSNGSFAIKWYWLEFEDEDVYRGFWSFDKEMEPENIYLDITEKTPNGPEFESGLYILHKLTRDSLLFLGNTESPTIWTVED